MITETTTTKPFCFTLMPFSADFDDIYNLGIKKSCIDCGSYIERVDEQYYQGTILDRIYNQISKADFIVADMTGKNPNVFYEVGYAHALGIPTILLTQKAEDIPFDLKQYPHIIYEGSIIKLREALNNKVKWIISNLGDNNRILRSPFEIYINGENINEGNLFIYVQKDKTNRLNFTIKNVSGKTFERGDYKLGIIVPAKYQSPAINLEMRRLPDGHILYMSNDFEKHFPEAYTSFDLDLFNHPEDEDKITVRIYTGMGIQDYDFYIRLDVSNDIIS